jgi:hypothetical protein
MIIITTTNNNTQFNTNFCLSTRSDKTA